MAKQESAKGLIAEAFKTLAEAVQGLGEKLQAAEVAQLMLGVLGKTSGMPHLSS